MCVCLGYMQASVCLCVYVCLCMHGYVCVSSLKSFYEKHVVFMWASV